MRSVGSSGARSRGAATGLARPGRSTSAQGRRKRGWPSFANARILAGPWALGNLFRTSRRQRSAGYRYRSEDHAKRSSPIEGKVNSPSIRGSLSLSISPRLSPQSLEVLVELTHYHESILLTPWLNGCKSFSRIPNTGKYSGLRDHDTCLWRSGFAKRWSPHAGRSRWAVQARSLTPFGSRCSTNILPETLKTCLLKSKQAMERARARDFR